MHTTINHHLRSLLVLSLAALAMPSWAQSSSVNAHQAMQHSSDSTATTPTNMAMHAAHGSGIYTSGSLESQWLWDKDGQGELSSELKSWIGLDYNKLYLKAHINKAESESSHYDVAAYYSRYLAEFWDLQLGVRYRNSLEHDQDDTAGVIGLHGLAPYFFETELELALSDQQSSLELEASRDFLWTQKWITEPYLDAKLIFNDQQTLAKRSGLSELEVGVQTRYEINKRLMPFFDLSYAYDKGYEGQNATDGIRYGLGINFKF